MTLFKLKCTKIAGFTVFKSLHWGIYYEAYGSLIAENNILIDNQVSLFSMVVEPDPVEHKAESRTTIVRNSLMIGQTPVFDCTSDIAPKNINSFYATMFAGSYGAGTKHVSKIGMVFSSFMGKTNKAPLEPW